MKKEKGTRLMGAGNSLMKKKETSLMVKTKKTRRAWIEIRFPKDLLLKLLRQGLKCEGETLVGSVSASWYRRPVSCVAAHTIVRRPSGARSQYSLFSADVGRLNQLNSTLKEKSIYRNIRVM
ncbi:hypothetical protein EGW08_006032 [Elysia chlorotica]|uniref:Uncharacterized protein n=1 Tax=Elysia chlorotica TaxID=188477 RepID=A0A433TX83_ELYCH|nr:hypothetical protein EGW08_006032 [Elysia chlorotica]